MTPNDWPLPMWIAHRGAGKLAPENTLAAFRLGASFGYRAFECDVKLSRDETPFLLHDADLDRTTDATGIAGERDWAELSLVDAGAWHSRQFAGEPLPTLKAIAHYIQNNGFALNIEIKPTPGQALRTGQVAGQAVRALWLDAGHLLPLFSSFAPLALQGARETAPEVPRALLLDNMHEGWFDEAQALACVAVVTNHRVMSAEVIGQLHHAGMRGLCYTVNDDAVVQRLLQWGVDGLITDAVDRFAPCAHSARTPASADAHGPSSGHLKL